MAERPEPLQAPEIDVFSGCAKVFGADLGLEEADHRLGYGVVETPWNWFGSPMNSGSSSD